MTIRSRSFSSVRPPPGRSAAGSALSASERCRRLEQLPECNDVLEAGTLLIGEGQPLRDLVEPEIEEQHQGKREQAGDEQELLRIAEAVHEPHPRGEEARHGARPPRRIDEAAFALP